MVQIVFTVAESYCVLHTLEVCGLAGWLPHPALRRQYRYCSLLMMVSQGLAGGPALKTPTGVSNKILPLERLRTNVSSEYLSPRKECRRKHRLAMLLSDSHAVITVHCCTAAGGEQGMRQL
jgi:hypothetical protein